MLAQAGARTWHYAVLASLQEYGPASQAELSGRSGIYRSDMVGVLNELAERDLVERAPGPAGAACRASGGSRHRAGRLLRL